MRFNRDSKDEPHETAQESRNMSMMDRLRARRNASRNARAIDRALREATSPAVRAEILAAAQRQYR
jgi:hypothetical protein